MRHTRTGQAGGYMHSRVRVSRPRTRTVGLARRRRRRSGTQDGGASMTSLLLRISVAAVRGWTRVYTWRMPPVVREARRAEIESDLWASRTDDVAGPALPMQIGGRLVRESSTTCAGGSNT